MPVHYISTVFLLIKQTKFQITVIRKSTCIFIVQKSFSTTCYSHTFLVQYSADTCLKCSRAAREMISKTIRIGKSTNYPLSYNKYYIYNTILSSLYSTLIWKQADILEIHVALIIKKVSLYLRVKLADRGPRYLRALLQVCTVYISEIVRQWISTSLLLNDCIM